MADLIAVVLVRSMQKVSKDIKDTLLMLKLTRKNSCVIAKKTPSIMGMIRKVKDYVTYGDVSKETLDLLSKKKNHHEGSSITALYYLNPPKKGYGRKGIKVSFSKGGALGNRKEKINELLSRMM